MNISYSSNESQDIEERLVVVIFTSGIRFIIIPFINAHFLSPGKAVSGVR